MQAKEPLSWLKIILIVLAVGLGVGLTLGVLGAALGFNAGSIFGGGIGAAEGITLVLLIMRRNKQIAEQKAAEPKQT